MTCEIIISIVALVLSVASLIISTVQNRRIHNENKRLQVLPVMTEDLIVWSRVIGTVEKRKDVIDELTVLVSPYDEFYNNNDIVISEAKKPILILVSKNSGGGIAENVCVKAVTIFTKSGEVELSSEKMLFSCSAGETVATRIYANIDVEEIQKVEVKIGYTDILGDFYLLTSIFEMQNNRKAEMKLLGTTREVKRR